LFGLQLIHGDYIKMLEYSYAMLQRGLSTGDGTRTTTGAITIVYWYGALIEKKKIET
jgi:hypothetical protein